MEEIVSQCNEQMKKVVANYKESLKTIRSGIVTPTALDKVFVDYYGEKTSVKALASVTATSATQLLVRPFDPSISKAMVGAINDSNLGVDAVANSGAIRVNFPQLTGDRRKEYVKQAKSYAEQAKISVRNVRSDFVNKIKKNKEFSKDMIFNYTDDVQEVTNKMNKEIEEIFAKKEKDLLTL